MPPLVGTSIALVSANVVAEEPITMGTVVVTGGEKTANGLEKPYAGGQVAKGGSLGILGTSNVMDTPFSTMNYTSTFMEDIQARTVADVIANDASVRSETASGGFGDVFKIRGFTVDNSDIGINGLYGLTPSTHVPVEMAERIELLKGPGALVNGIAPTGSIGGSINLITKRADEKPLTRVTTSYQSAGQYGLGLDFGRRFGENKEWGVRVNSSFHNGEASVKDGNQRLGFASVGLDYSGSRLRWSLDAFTQHEKIKDFRSQISFDTTGMTALPAIPSGRQNFYPGTELDFHNNTLISGLEYDLTDKVTAYLNMGYAHNWYNQLFPGTYGANQAGDFTVYNSYYDAYSKTFSANTGLRTKFATGDIAHTLTLGANYSKQETGYFYGSTFATASSNLYNPSAIPSPDVDRLDPMKGAENTLYSLAFTDTMSFADDRVLLTVGARHQTVEQDGYDAYGRTGAIQSQYSASAVTPLVGIVVKPVQDLSLYANFTEGLTPGSQVDPTSTTYANAGAVLKPYKSKQYEVGVKKDWGNMTTAISLFQIAKPSAVEDTTTHIYGYNGEERHRGIELSAYGEVKPGLRLMTSAVLMQADLTKTQGGTNDGHRAPGVPARTFNLGADWDVPSVAGLSLNGKMTTSSRSYLTAANTLSIGGWTTYDVGARYKTTFSSKPVVFRATVANVFDKRYWVQQGDSAYGSVNAPRTFLLSASVDF